MYSCVKLLPSKLPHHDGLYSQTVSQNKFFFPKDDFVGYFIIITRKTTTIPLTIGQSSRVNPAWTEMFTDVSQNKPFFLLP